MDIIILMLCTWSLDQNALLITCWLMQDLSIVYFRHWYLYTYLLNMKNKLVLTTIMILLMCLKIDVYVKLAVAFLTFLSVAFVSAGIKMLTFEVYTQAAFPNGPQLGPTLPNRGPTGAHM